MTSEMTPESAERILSQASGKVVVTLGDLMLDQFIWGTVERISPEAPVPVVRTSRESFHLGGAGNVAANIAALGGRPIPVGVIGEGTFADQLLATLARDGIPGDGALRVAGRVTTVKTRIVAHSQQVVRYDREQDDPLDDAAAGRLASRALERCESADALIVSDYEKGCVTPLILQKILPAAKRRGIPIVIDPKPGHWRAYRPATAITPNSPEASLMSGVRLRAEEDVERAGRAILEELGCDAVLLTRGEKGMLLLEASRPSRAIAATSREVFDVTGAGDTVVAALALGLAAGCSMLEAATLANAAAGVVVGKVGTAVASPSEVVDALSS